jgi:hypothetical protein
MPKTKPTSGIIVTHFSFGSTFFSQGFSISPFLTLLEWKYLDGGGRAAEEDEATDDVGLEVKGDEKGLFVGGVGEISSKGFGWLLLSGVDGCIGVVVVAVEMPEGALPR